MPAAIQNSIQISNSTQKHPVSIFSLTIMKNLFLNAAVQGFARTENGAVAIASTGSVLVDQFGKASALRGRALKEVFADQAKIAREDAAAALRFVFYNRLVTRKTNLLGDQPTSTEKVQKGQGQRDESFKRFLWYAKNQPDTFYNNLWLMPTVGSFRDIWDILLLADEGGIALNLDRVFETYLALAQYSDLAKKYMPSIQSNPSCVTERARLRNKYAKRFMKYLEISAAEYRALKSSGTAHEWQKAISRRELSNINFGRIPGKALFLLSKGKFLANQHLEDVYMKWLDTQPTAKFTGYAYELLKAYQEKAYAAPKQFVKTINKQFDGLIATAKQDQGGIKGNVWCALDTSGSMGSSVSGQANLSAMDVAKSLAIYFATLNEGAFHKSIINFGNKSHVHQLSGEFTDMVSQLPSSWGGTNFQSVIDEIIRIRHARPEVPLSDFPQAVIVVSDMQFNPSGTGVYSDTRRSNGVYSVQELSNHEAAVAKLHQVFPREFVAGFKFIWWDVTGRVTSNQPSGLDDQGTYMFSGFDGSVITLLLGGDPVVVNGVVKANPSMEEMVQAALNQEVLTYATLG